MKVQIIQRLSLLFILCFGMVAASTVSAQEQVIHDEKIYIKIQVDGLSCPFCAYGLEKKLKKVEGAADTYIDVKEGYVTFNVSNENQPDKEKLKEIIKKAGFTARTIDFSVTPFEKGSP